MSDGIFTVGEDILPEMMPPCINKAQREIVVAALGDAYKHWVNEDGVEYSSVYPDLKIDHGVIVTPSVRYDGTNIYTNDGDELDVFDDCLTIEALVDEVRCTQKNAEDEIHDLLVRFPSVQVRWLDESSVVFRTKKRCYAFLYMIEHTLVHFSFFYYNNDEIIKSSFIASNNQIHALVLKLMTLSES